MSDLDDIEAKLQKVKLFRQVEHALAQIESGIKHKAIISAVAASDEAECERSVTIGFSADESVAIFEKAKEVLQIRYEALKVEIGV